MKLIFVAKYSLSEEIYILARLLNFRRQNISSPIVFFVFFFFFQVVRRRKCDSPNDIYIYILLFALLLKKAIVILGEAIAVDVFGQLWQFILCRDFDSNFVICRTCLLTVQILLTEYFYCSRLTVILLISPYSGNCSSRRASYSSNSAFGSWASW
jgi:hypothetical protein